MLDTSYGAGVIKGRIRSPWPDWRCGKENTKSQEHCEEAPRKPLSCGKGNVKHNHLLVEGIGFFFTLTNT